MREIIIVQEDPINDLKTVPMTESYLDDLISSEGIIRVLKEYKIPESYLLDKQFDKEIILEFIDPSENFLRNSMEIGYLNREDLSMISTKSISDLSSNFIDEFSNYLDWKKIILYYVASENYHDWNKYSKIIDKNNLWDLISLANLPIEFIRREKENLNWNNLSISNFFSEEEKIEFKSYLKPMSDLITLFDQDSIIFDVSKFENQLKSTDEESI